MSATTRPGSILVGHIAKAHGILGEVSLVLYGEDPTLVDGEIFLRKGPDTPMQKHTVASRREHHGSLLIHLASIHDRTTAEQLRGCQVYVAREKLPALEDDEAYIADLLGLRVLVAEESGSEREIGTIKYIDSPAGQELWSITAHNGKEVLLPAVPDFVREINVDGGHVVITPPPGLLDLYLNE